MILVDANLLVYARVEDFPQHRAAHAWLDQQLNGRTGVGLPWQSLLAFVRLTSNPRIFARPLSLGEAWTQVEEWLDRPVRHGGPPLLQRTGLAAALLADPEVLLLDEPLRALEADERSRMLRLPGRRRTVVLASRYPASEAGHVSHVALLRHGRVVLLAPVADLEAAGLPLSVRGIDALAERREAEPAHTELDRPAVAAR